jgi:hypothetical protein
MNKHEKELLRLATEARDNKSHDKFKSWLRGFRLPATETKELRSKFKKLIEQGEEVGESGKSSIQTTRE